MKDTLRDVKCPNCQRIYKLTEDLIGQKVKCRCSFSFRVTPEHLVGEARSASSTLQVATADAAYVYAKPPVLATPPPMPMGEPGTMSAASRRSRRPTSGWRPSCPR
jgi:hypothetical protein